MHAGITPQYRGVHGGYWAVVNNDPEHCGVTIHFVDKGIDTGGNQTKCERSELLKIARLVQRTLYNTMGIFAELLPRESRGEHRYRNQSGSRPEPACLCSHRCRATTRANRPLAWPTPTAHPSRLPQSARDRWHSIETPRGRLLATPHRRMVFNSRFCRGVAPQESLLR